MNDSLRRVRQLVRELNVFIAIANANKRDFTHAEAKDLTTLYARIRQLNSDAHECKRFGFLPNEQEQKQAILAGARLIDEQIKDNRMYNAYSEHAVVKTSSVYENKDMVQLKGSDGFSDFGAFLAAVGMAGRGQSTDRRLMRLSEMSHESKALSEGVGASAGFLVPSEHRSEILSAVYDASDILQRCNRFPMRYRTIIVPTMDQTSTTSGQDHWHGGIKLYWKEEASEKTETTPEFRQLQLTTHTLTGYLRASNELVMDSPTFGKWLTSDQGFVGAFSWMLDDRILNGTGAGQPLGVIGAGGTVTVNRAASGTFTIADLLSMRQALLPVAKKAVWLFSPTCLPTLAQLSGPVGNLSYIVDVPDILAIPSKLGNIPIIWTEHCSAMGTCGDVLLCDFSGYALGDRQAVTVESSIHDRFQHNQTSYRCVWRGDGQPQLSAPIYDKSGTIAQSFFVELGTKAT